MITIITVTAPMVVAGPNGTRVPVFMAPSVSHKSSLVISPLACPVIPLPRVGAALISVKIPVPMWVASQLANIFVESGNWGRGKWPLGPGAPCDNLSIVSLGGRWTSGL